MSGKYENKGSIEQALKMVFYIHRNTVKEFQTEIGQWIERCESFQKESSRLKEKLQSLEKENERLKEENLVLKNNFENNLFVQSEIPKKISDSIQVHADYKLRKHNHDSTDDPTDQTIIKPVNQQLNSLHLNDELTDQLKNKNKRSRYREDISPMIKKYKVSLEGDNSANNTLNYVESSSRKKHSKECIQNEPKAIYVDKANKLCRKNTFRNNFASEIYMDHTLRSRMYDGKDANVNSDAKVNIACVVPETLGMETYSSRSENNYSVNNTNKVYTSSEEIMSPVFTKPPKYNSNVKKANINQILSDISKMESEPLLESSSPLFVQLDNSFKECSMRNLSNRKPVAKIKDGKHTSNCAIEETSTTFVQKSGTEISEKITSPKNESVNVTTDNIKQTMLSQMFTGSPKFVVPLLETEYESKETEKVIELSTTDTPQNRRTSIDKHRSMTSPDKYFMSPQRYPDPYETVAHSPSVLDSLSVICPRRSPMKLLNTSSILIKSHYNSDISKEDLDVTVAPSLTDVGIMDSDKVINGSISPDIHLRQYFQGHDSTTSPDLKKSSRITKNMCDIVTEVRNTRRTVDNAITEESQSLLCSSQSYQFGTRKEMNKILKTQDKNIAELEGVLKHEFIDEESSHPTMFNLSYDRVVRKKDVEFAYVKVVKKQEERKKLQGHSCKECYDYYKLSGMSEEDIQSRIKDCSRHRAEYIPPDTPDHFWSIGFPDTQECHERGYAQSELNTKPSTYRRKHQLQKKFKSKDKKEPTC